MAGGRRAASPATGFRFALLLLSGVLSVFAEAAAGSETYAAFSIALLATAAVAADRVTALRRHPVVLSSAEALLTGVLIAVSGGDKSPLLPYLLAPMLALGLAGTTRQVVMAGGFGALGLGCGRLGTELVGATGSAQALKGFVLVGGQWVVLGVAVGVIGRLARQVAEEEPADALDSEDRYGEARELLEQLRAVTRHLPGGLDVATVAEGLLDRCALVTPSTRSAVLVQPSAGALVPAAVRGTTRVPWRAPLSEPGPLQRAWETRLPVVNSRAADSGGRRAGSTLAVVPLLSAGEPFGLLILESLAVDAFSPSELSELARLAARSSLRLETGLLFEEVRGTVSLQERDRLAREMHDGVAQELASVGYQLDALRAHAARVDEGLATRLVEVRKELTRMISDIRLSITDLRTSVSNDRGLGAAVSSYVRAVGSGQRVRTHVSLQQSAFRLPGETEVLLFQVMQVVAQDARKAGRADNLWVTLAVNPPSAHLCVEHDGTVQDGTELPLTELSARVARLGGALVVAPRLGSGVTVEVSL